MEDDLKEAEDLTVTETFGSLNGEPFALGDEKAYLLAVKN